MLRVAAAECLCNEHVEQVTAHYFLNREMSHIFKTVCKFDHVYNLTLSCCKNDI